MYTKDKKWIVVDGGRNIIFNSSREAWGYVFLMREIRPKAPEVPKSIYPVKTLNPVPTRKRKKVVFMLMEEKKVVYT
jgi:hypothetical protein